MDGISQLPEPIIHHILSFLPNTIDAAQTSVVSKAWKRAWASYPALVFDERQFGVAQALRPFLSLACFSKENSPELWEAKEKFYNFVDNSLFEIHELKKLRIRHLGIYISFVDSRLSSFLDKWVRLATDAHVKELVLSIRTRREWDDLPPSIFDAKSLTYLELSGCINLQDYPQLSINLRSLERLLLYKLRIDDLMIQKLFSSCPLIEDISLSNCWGFNSICVSGLVKLKNFTLWISLSARDRGIEVEIEAPISLQSLFIDYHAGSSKCIMKVTASRDLTSIVFRGCTITDQFFYDLNSKFPSLQELNIASCCLPDWYTISSHQLQKLYLHFPHYNSEAEIDTPNLLLFDYEADKLPTSITAPCQWKITLYEGMRVYLDPYWFLELKAFLSKSTEIEYLHLVISSSVKIARRLEKLREVLLPPHCQVKCLQLGIIYLSTSSCIALLDVLLWICRPKTLYLNLKEPEKFIEYLYKKLRDIEHPEGCSCGFLKCWLHYLQDLEIETDTKMVHKLSLQTNDLVDDLLTLPPGKVHLHFNW